VQNPANKYIKVFTALMVVALTGFFAFKAQRYISSPRIEHPSAAVDDATRNIYAKAVISTEMLNELEWRNVGELTQAIGADSDKINQVIRFITDVKNPAALYLKGFVLMITNKPLLALSTFDRIAIKDIPTHFLYPPYRLHRQVRPNEPNRYIGPLSQSIDAGSISPLITARFQSQEGDFYSALANYLQTDPGQWVTFDVKCIKKIGRHAGMSSEMRRMILGALKSGRVSTKIEKPLRQVLARDSYPEELRAFKSKLKTELHQNSSTGQIAVSSIKQLIETRNFFMQRDYQAISNQHQNTDPIALPNESVLILFLSGVQLEDRLEIDRWGQEIKRRYPNQEVINWVSDLTTSVK
jgi:hypothetical protein